MLRPLYLTLITLLLSLMAWGATPVTKPKAKLILKNDSTAVVVRHFDKAALKQYSADKTFQYKEGYVGESFWDRFWHWFWNLFRGAKLNSDALGSFFQYLLIFLGIVAILFVIFWLADVDVFHILRRNANTAGLAYDESVEDIHAIDLDSEIDKAVSQQNYRFAVRLLYLRSLKQLSDAGLIHWEINKTNSIYIAELADTQQRDAFRQITRKFEYVWYGELAIDVTVFERIKLLFDNFKIKAS